jgi:hypothetical protein
MPDIDSELRNTEPRLGNQNYPRESAFIGGKYLAPVFHGPHQVSY